MIGARLKGKVFRLKVGKNQNQTMVYSDIYSFSSFTAYHLLGSPSYAASLLFT
jgi:hypothetical protein